MSVLEHIEKYYKLKSVYESNGATKCIQCQRNVGTHFAQKKMSKYVQYSIKCGDLNNPCDLHVDIHYGCRYSFAKEIEKKTKQIEDLILKTIMLKNKSLFINDDDKLVDAFKEITDKLREYEEHRSQLIEENIKINFNPGEAERLTDSEKRKEKYMKEYANLITEFHNTGEIGYIRDIIELYQHSIIPISKEIMELKYDKSFVTYDEQNNMHYLQQIIHSLEKDEYSLSKIDKVVAFKYTPVIGNKTKGKNNAVLNANANANVNANTLKNTNIIHVKNKTLKLKIKR